MIGLPPHVETDWDTFWRWEIARRKVDPVDFRRWKADSSRALRGLPAGADRHGRPPRLLDSTCGLGHHAIIQHEVGFSTEACDASHRVLEAARLLMQAEGVDVPVFQAHWESLGQMRPARYDLVFNDEIHQVLGVAGLRAALAGIRGTLRPGGWLVFFFADAAKPDDGPNQAEHEWNHMERERVAWSLQADGLEVTHHVRAERPEPDLILERHSYRIRQPDGDTRVERTTMPKNYHWDWNHIVPVLEETGFDRVDSHRFINVHGRTYSLNLARRA